MYKRDYTQKKTKIFTCILFFEEFVLRFRSVDAVTAQEKIIICAWESRDEN